MVHVGATTPAASTDQPIDRSAELVLAIDKAHRLFDRLIG
jgi:hypothetical protein